MKVVFQTEDGKIFVNRDDAAKHEEQLKAGKKEDLEIFVLDMPRTKYDRIFVVRLSEYEKLKARG